MPTKGLISAKADFLSRTAFYIALTLLLIVVFASAALILPRLRIGRSITWNNVALDFRRPVICCASLYGARLFCMPAGKSLLNSFPNLEFLTISVSLQAGGQTDCELAEEPVELSALKKGVKVVASKRIEEAPGPDPDLQPRRVWSRNVLEREKDQLVMAVDAAVVCGKTFSATVYGALTPPWPEDEFLHLVRSIQRVPDVPDPSVTPRRLKEIGGTGLNKDGGRRDF